MPKFMNKTELKEKLTDEEYRVAVEGGTERPFSGDLLDEKRQGSFACKVCGSPLFSSETKFESGTGWPSFDKALPNAIKYIKDISFGMERAEVRCDHCDAHLGHVFDDGPTETGERYCVNSVCLQFKEESK